MKHYTLTPIPRTYANNGQHLEQTYRYNKTHILEKADNRKNAPDFENVQIKSARATICKGTNFAREIAKNRATIFAYITQNYECYEMTKSEFTHFVQLFGEATRESTKNGGHLKTRLKHETRALLQWLATH